MLKFNSHLSLSLIFLCSLCWIHPSLAQAQNDEKIPPTRISFLLVGDRTEAESFPFPKAIRASGRLPGSEKDDALRNRGVGLKQLVDLVDIELAADTPLALKVEADIGSKWKEWSKLTIPAGPTGRDFTFLYFKEKPQADWINNTPKMMVLDNSLDALPVGSVRAINVSSHPVICEINGKEFILRPGAKGVFKPNNEDEKRLHCKFMFQNPQTKERKVFFRRNFNRNQANRQQIVFYNLDGKQGRLFSPINLMLVNLLPLDRKTISEQLKARKERAALTVPPPPGGWKTQAENDTVDEES